jgi:hypothetical protein
MLFVLVFDLFVEISEQSTAKGPRDHIKLTLALVQFINKCFGFSSPIKQLVSSLVDFCYLSLAPWTSSLRYIDASLVEAMPTHKVDGRQLKFLPGTFCTVFIAVMSRLCLDFFDLTLHIPDVLHVLLYPLLALLDFFILLFDGFKQIPPKDPEFKTLLALHDF